RRFVRRRPTDGSKQEERWQETAAKARHAHEFLSLKSPTPLKRKGSPVHDRRARRVRKAQLKTKPGAATPQTPGFVFANAENKNNPLSPPGLSRWNSDCMARE